MGKSHDPTITTLKKMLQKKPGKGLTTRDIARELGIAHSSADRLLGDLFASGVVIQSEQVLRPARDGKLRPVPTYRISASSLRKAAS